MNLNLKKSAAAAGVAALLLSGAAGAAGCRVVLKTLPAAGTRAAGAGTPLSVRVRGCATGTVMPPEMACGTGAGTHRTPAVAQGGGTYRLQGCPAGETHRELVLTWN